MEEETTAPRRGSRHHSRQSARSPAARPSLSFEAASTTSTGRPQRASPASSRPLRCPTQPDAPENNAGQPRDRKSSRSSRLTICRSPGVPQLAVGRSPVPAGPAAGLLTSSPSWPAWLSLRSCDWQGKGARGRGPGALALNPCPKLSLHRLHGLRFIGVSASSSNAGLIRCLHTWPSSLSTCSSD